MAAQAKKSPQPVEVKPRTGYGDRLAEIIAAKTGEQVPCNECHSEIARLNRMTAEEIRGEATLIAERMIDRASRQARTWWQRLACQVSPILMRRRVEQWILEALEPISLGHGKWQSTVRHLTMHVYPTKHHQGWQWNLSQMAARAHLFNGLRVLGIAVDRRTVTAADVVDYARTLGLRWDRVIEVKNRPAIREVATWLPMLETLNPASCDANEVVFSCHAKGVRHDVMQDHITAWAELMWKANLDEWQTVQWYLSHFVMAGAFRRYGNFTTQGNHRWHYSGTFYWWRLAEIGRRNWRKVDQRFFGTESWPGHQCRPEETACLFLDHCGDLYDRNYWEQTVWPAWNQQYAASDASTLVSH